MPAHRGLEGQHSAPPASCWMLWNRLSMRAGPDPGRPGPSQRQGRSISCHGLHPAPRRGNLEPSVGSVGDSYDNALAETINGLYKAEVIWRQRSWPNASAVEMATLRWVDWYNNQRLFGPSATFRRGRSQLLCSSRPRYGCVTQLKLPPENPGRFRACPSRCVGKRCIVL
jgi:hypothetical protein